MLWLVRQIPPGACGAEMVCLTNIFLIVGLLATSLKTCHSCEILPDDGNFTCGNDGVLKFTNWAMNLGAVEVGRGIASEPVTLQDVQAEVANFLQVRAIQKSFQKDLNIRALGRGHSWTPVFVDDGDWLMLTHKFAFDDGSRIRFSGLDEDGIPLVQVAAGVTTGELALFMDAEENQEQLKYLGLPSDVILDTARYGGIVAMGCHGAAWDHGSVPDFVQELSIVDASGAHRVLCRNTTDPVEFNAGVASFGLFGITHSITLKLAPYPETPSLLVEDSAPLMNTYFSSEGLVGTALKDLAENSYSVQVLWFALNGASVNQSIQDWDPYSQDRLWVKRTTLSAALERDGKPRSTFPGAAKPGPSLDSFVEMFGAQAQQFLQAANSVEIYKVLASFSLNESVTEGEQLTSFSGGIHHLLGLDELKTMDFEMAFKLDTGFDVVSRAWNAAVDITKAFLRGERGEPKHPANLALEFRFTGHSDALMSPAYGKPGDHFLWIEVVGTTENEGWEEFVNELFDEWKVILGPNGEKPKPHWAKWTPAGRAKLPRVGEYVKMVYAEQIAEFNAQLSGYDPRGVFLNDFFRDLGFGVGQ
ncbi:unnamed protein product [Ostreobium quekettii]|uniref:FAD-binding PCMH-type domain-containing protein n=1 Tax=Ostreobium quekettii TaxID=121088 RepID=A0A8S1IU33_9CHLO|nr:unnamed protein product [Ostreobium quekettii]|eukprot:evm.model.scf_425EXC.12 EVM.evm.TU.scf_425EXC.12   scf_425EXC:71426-74806(+)